MEDGDVLVDKRLYAHSTSNWSGSFIVSGTDTRRISLIGGLPCCCRLVMEEGDMPLAEWQRKEATGELPASGDFEVDALAAERMLGKKRQFLVKWKVRSYQASAGCSALTLSRCVWYHVWAC